MNDQMTVNFQLKKHKYYVDCCFQLQMWRENSVYTIRVLVSCNDCVSTLHTSPYIALLDMYYIMPPVFYVCDLAVLYIIYFVSDRSVVLVRFSGVTEMWGLTFCWVENAPGTYFPFYRHF